tara:strand:+ start:300 stop:899 length:600 start_codon:yes stop_codon:yes gene_type:complete
MSTLTVQNIQGSSSSSNTINVASGHKISGAVGSIVTPGNVIQFQSSVTQNASSTTWSGTANSNYPYSGNRTSRTYTLARTVTITPTSTSSILYCTGVVGWTSMAMTATMGHGSIITRNDDGAGGALSDTIDNSDYPWYAHDYIASSNLYFPVETVIGTFSPSSTSTQTIRLRPYVYVEGGNTATGKFQGTSLFVMEIAQ